MSTSVTSTSPWISISCLLFLSVMILPSSHIHVADAFTSTSTFTPTSTSNLGKPRCTAPSLHAGLSLSLSSHHGAHQPMFMSSSRFNNANGASVKPKAKAINGSGNSNGNGNSSGSKRNGSRPPARIRASKTTTVRVQSPEYKSNSSGATSTRARSANVNANTNTKTNTNVTLDDYMKLPAAQYTCVPMPLNSSLQRVRGTKDRFRLDVPPMKLQSPGVPLVEVRPVVMATVSVEPEKERVKIRSDACQIGGSKIIDDLKINDFFDFSVEICLTWESDDGNGNDNGNGNADSYSYIDANSNEDGGASASQSGTIMAQSNIAVNLNPPGPFALVPRQILEAVGNRAIALTLGSLQKNFMISLGKDFERWVMDESYRMERRELEEAMGKEFKLYGNGNGNGNRNGSTSSDIPLDETLMAYLDR